jgi:riboflavin synthase|tara:strand:- start:643 stop:1236 length:594 start_codon:yes stop_codon:yes gene_type:complete
MFNGIIFNQGIVKKIEKRSKGLNIFISSKIKLSKKDLGASISCDGVCLTLISVKNKLYEFYLSNETILRSKFKKIKIGDKINLEQSLRYGQRISGHICQGHVDTVANIAKIQTKDKAQIISFKINKNYKKNLIEKASILINGVSLTISKVTKDGFEIWLIPHTLKLTNLKNLKKNDLVNVEIDILSKYIKKFIHEKK